MAKANYKRFVTPTGTAIFPHLTQPDTKFDSDGVYTVTLAIPSGEAQEFLATLEQVRDEFRAEWEANAKPAQFKSMVLADLFEEQLDEEGEETGNILIKAKQKAVVHGKNGEVWNKTVKLFDAQNNVINPQAIWGGSKLVLAGAIVPYYMASTKSLGVSLRLAAAQVIDLVAGGGQDASEFGFGQQEGYTADTVESVAAEDAGGDEPDDGDDDF